MYKAKISDNGKWVITRINENKIVADRGDMFFYDLELAMASVISLLAIEHGLIDKDDRNDEWKAMTAKYMTLDL